MNRLVDLASEGCLGSSGILSANEYMIMEDFQVAYEGQSDATCRFVYERSSKDKSSTMQMNRQVVDHAYRSTS